MTVITGWRHRKPAPSSSFSDDPAFNGSNAKNSRAARVAKERKDRRLGLESINTEPLKPADKRKRLAKASI
jgi:hypothetical protein